MLYGSVCSGIEAATVAWHPLGWKPQWFSQFDPEHSYKHGPDFPSAVLAHHYPNIPNLGDMTKLHESETFNGRSIELLVGGCPCQSFSVAGLRKGLADPRGNLTLHLLKILDLKRPRWLVYENVPGLLSSWSDDEAGQGSGLRWQSNDFDTFTSGLRELGYGVAWRVLDAQFFGIPQRRRRVFVIGHLGDWRPAAAVLFERQSLCGYPPPSRKKREGLTSGPADSLGSRGNRSHTELDGHGAYVPDPEVPQVADTLRSGSTNKASHGKLNGSDRVTLVPQAYGGNRTGGPLDVATAVRAKGGSGHGDFESETFIADVAPALSTKAGANAGKTMEVDGFLIPERTGSLSASGKAAGSATEQDARSGLLIPETVHSLRADGFDASEDGTGRGTPLVPVQEPIAFSSKDHGLDAGETSPTLRAGGHNKSHANGGVPPAVVYDMRGNGDGNIVPNLTGDHASRPTDYTPMVFESRVARNGRGGPSDVVSPLKAQSGEDGRGDGAPLIFHENQRAEVTTSETAGSLKIGGGKPGQGYPALMSGMQVRRLTPRECERLQGFPDDYTLIPHGKSHSKDFEEMFNYLRRTYPKMSKAEARRLAADGPRYKALGNSMAVPVMSWIGKRIQLVEDILNGKNS